jgi:hypothetical protein
VWWTVRDIVWCLRCKQREVNGDDTELCARCEAWLIEIIDRLEREWQS